VLWSLVKILVSKVFFLNISATKSWLKRDKLYDKDFVFISKQAGALPRAFPGFSRMGESDTARGNTTLRKVWIIIPLWDPDTFQPQKLLGNVNKTGH